VYGYLKKNMITIDPKVHTAKLQGYLQGSVGPRPIAFASTVDRDGNPNLSPFLVLFKCKPAYSCFFITRVRDNSIKHTLINCEATR
jgi:hypothetical protein